VTIKSHRCGYRIPKKTVEEANAIPASEVKIMQGYPPVECVKNGIDLNQALIMRPNDLTFEDGKYLFESGVPKAQVRKLYGFKNDPAFYVVLKKLDLHPWPPKEPVSDPVAEPIAFEPVDEPRKEAVKAVITKVLDDITELPPGDIQIVQDDEFVWYDKSPYRPTIAPYVTFRISGNLYFSAPFASMLPQVSEVRIGFNKDFSRIKISTSGNCSYHLTHNDKNSISVRTSAKNILPLLKECGITLPVKYIMQGGDGEWIGVIQA
jgi:hypothetical protein